MIKTLQAAAFNLQFSEYFPYRNIIWQMYVNINVKRSCKI